MATTTVRTGQPSGDTPVGMGDAQIRAVLSGLMLGLLLAALDQTIVSTALPTIVGELGGLNHLSWVVTAYLVTSTASTPLWGKISDLYGRKPMYLIAIVVFLVASALAGLSQSMWQLIATRGLQGIGGGGLLALPFAIVGDVIAASTRATSARSSACPVSPGRCSAAFSWIGCRGGGSSTSTCRSVPLRSSSSAAYSTCAISGASTPSTTWAPHCSWPQ